jgi:hypothetical protein
LHNRLHCFLYICINFLYIASAICKVHLTLSIPTNEQHYNPGLHRGKEQAAIIKLAVAVSVKLLDCVCSVAGAVKRLKLKERNLTEDANQYLESLKKRYEVNREKGRQFHEQVIKNSKETHTVDEFLHEALEREDRQILRLIFYDNRSYKIDIATKTYAVLIDFKLKHCNFKDFDILKLNEKYKYYLIVADNFKSSTDLSDEIILRSNEIELKNHFIHNFISVFFHAHLLADVKLKNYYIDSVIGFFGTYIKREISYSDFT